MSDITSKPARPCGEGRPEKKRERERKGGWPEGETEEYLLGATSSRGAVTLPVIFARFYGNLRIIQLGPGDHFPRYANSTVRPATRRTVLTTVVAGGKRSAKREAGDWHEGDQARKSKTK